MGKKIEFKEDFNLAFSLLFIYSFFEPNNNWFFGSVLFLSPTVFVAIKCS